jgi:hypothetical protein
VERCCPRNISALASSQAALESWAGVWRGWVRNGYTPETVDFQPWGRERRWRGKMNKRRAACRCLRQKDLSETPAHTPEVPQVHSTGKVCRSSVVRGGQTRSHKGLLLCGANQGMQILGSQSRLKPYSENRLVAPIRSSVVSAGWGRLTTYQSVPGDCNPRDVLHICPAQSGRLKHSVVCTSKHRQEAGRAGRVESHAS